MATIDSIYLSLFTKDDLIEKALSIKNVEVITTIITQLNDFNELKSQIIDKILTFIKCEDSLDLFKLLLNKGLKITIHDVSMIRLEEKYISCLIPNIDLNIKNKLLFLTPARELIDIAKLLLDNGADPNCTNDQNNTILWLACNYLNIELVKLLIEHKADVNKISYNDYYTQDWSPLQKAASLDAFNIVNLLLDNGANIDYQNRNKYTSLMYACNGGNLETTDLLLRRGANMKLKNIDGNTAQDFNISKKVSASFDKYKNKTKYYYGVCFGENKQNIIFNNIKELIHDKKYYYLMELESNDLEECTIPTPFMIAVMNQLAGENNKARIYHF